MDEVEAESWSQKADALIKPETVAAMVAAHVALVENRDAMSEHAAQIEDQPVEYQHAVVSNIELITELINTLWMVLPYKATDA